MCCLALGSENYQCLYHCSCLFGFPSLPFHIITGDCITGNLSFIIFESILAITHVRMCTSGHRFVLYHLSLSCTPLLSSFLEAHFVIIVSTIKKMSAMAMTRCLEFSNATEGCFRVNGSDIRYRIKPFDVIKDRRVPWRISTYLI
jgi:hypothetical protein